MVSVCPSDVGVYLYIEQEVTAAHSKGDLDVSQ